MNTRTARTNKNRQLAHCILAPPCGVNLPADKSADFPIEIDQCCIDGQVGFMSCRLDHFHDFKEGRLVGMVFWTNVAFGGFHDKSILSAVARVPSTSNKTSRYLSS